MKLFKNKIFTLFCAALIAVFLVASTPKPKEAQAIGVSALIAAAVTAAQNAIVKGISTGFSALASNFNDLILDQFLPIQQDMFQGLGQESIATAITTVNQSGEQLEAVIAAEQTREKEIIALKERMEAKVSDAECQLATGSLLVNGGYSELEKNRELIDEVVRKERNFVSGGSTAAGIVVSSRIQKQERFAKFCSDDEQRGNIADVCTNPDPERVDKDIAMEDLFNCTTIPRSNIDALAQMLRYTIGSTGGSPLPNNFDDPAISDAYLDQKRNEAVLAPAIHAIKEQAARALEPENCIEVPGGDSNRLSFVNRIDAELNIPIRADRPCPSQTEIECYYRSKQFKSPLFNGKANIGPTQTGRVEDIVKRIMSEMEHETTLLTQQQNVIKSVGFSQSLSAPTVPIQ